MIKLKEENAKKKKVLKNLKEGNSIDEESLPPIKFPCKLNDLRFFIKDLSPVLKEDDLIDYFEIFGEIIDLEITKKIAVIVFTHFFNERPGKHHEIQGIKIKLENAYECCKGPPSTVFITGAIGNMTGDCIRQHLRYFGTIVDFRRSVKLSRCIFVKFEDPESVKILLNSQLHKFKSDGKEIEVQIFEVDELLHKL